MPGNACSCCPIARPAKAQQKVQLNQEEVGGQKRIHMILTEGMDFDESNERTKTRETKPPLFITYFSVLASSTILKLFFPARASLQFQSFPQTNLGSIPVQLSVLVRGEYLLTLRA